MTLKLLHLPFLMLISSTFLFAVQPITKESRTKVVEPIKEKEISQTSSNTKQNEVKIPFTDFNQAHTYDYGCLSLLAEQKFRLEYKKLEAFFYSINSEIWRTNEIVKKKTPKPTIKNIQEDLLTLCNNAVSQSKSMEFLIYQTAITYEMSETRFFDISSFVQNTTEEDFKNKSTMKKQK